MTLFNIQLITSLRPVIACASSCHAQRMPQTSCQQHAYNPQPLWLLTFDPNACDSERLLCMQVRQVSSLLAIRLFSIHCYASSQIRPFHIGNLNFQVFVQNEIQQPLQYTYIKTIEGFCCKCACGRPQKIIIKKFARTRKLKP